MSEVKKICFISLKAYQLFNENIKTTFGGAEVQLYLIASEFAKNPEYDVNFIVADYGQKKIESYDNVKVWKSLNFKNSILSQIKKFYNIFKQINADIYIQRSLSVFSGLIALYCKLKKKKFIYMVSSNRETDGSHKIFNKAIAKRFAVMVFRYSSSIITQNEYQDENLKNRGINSVLIKSLCIIPKKSDYIKKDYNLWIGRSDFCKQTHLFIELANKFPEEKFIMICPKSTGMSDNEYNKIVESAEKTNNLKFYKYISYSQIDEFYKKAKTFINTSIYEGFPNTFLQAAKYSVPILSLNVNPGNFINEYNCGFCAENSMIKFYKYFGDLLKNKKNILQKGKNARKYLEKNHSPDIILSKINDVFYYE